MVPNRAKHHIYTYKINVEGKYLYKARIKTLEEYSWMLLFFYRRV